MASPGLATAAAHNAKEVLVRNTSSDPVPTQAVGTTPVTGEVSISGPVTTAPQPGVPVIHRTHIDGPYTVPNGMVLHLTTLSGGVTDHPDQDPPRLSLQLKPPGEGPAVFPPAILLPLTASSESWKSATVPVDVVVPSGTALQAVATNQHPLGGWQLNLMGVLRPA